MKKRIFALITVLCILFLSSCEGVKYVKGQFYSAETLNAGSVPELPQPNGDMLYRTGTNAYCDKIYIASDESAEEYFKRILDYIQGVDFKIVGTVDWVKRTAGNLFLVDDSYVFKSTKEITEVSVNNYYNDEIKYEPYYSIIISNNEIEQGEYHEPYQHPENEDIHWDGYYDYNFRGTLIRVCMDDNNTIEYDGNVFEYDYWLEVRVNELVWMDYGYDPQE